MARDTVRTILQWVILAIAALRTDDNLVNPASIRMTIREQARRSGTKYAPVQEEIDVQESIDMLRSIGLLLEKDEAAGGDVEDIIYITEKGIRVWGELTEIQIGGDLESHMGRRVRTRKVPAVQSPRRQEKVTRLHNDQLRRFSSLVNLKRLSVDTNSAAAVAGSPTELQDAIALRSEVALLRSRLSTLGTQIASMTTRVADLEAALDWSNP
ncbi:hypothetical protein D9611_009736 [Ephemerocybe angulata]|uniref:Uncharacterized protein n=1 Tax=Ephemerocybe angulata TaxID=980116 RepID=A0A8H5C6H4_9AGAR|nr:hypothetical protein D9611_009736 [Tulosesus angulatus]